MDSTAYNHGTMSRVSTRIGIASSVAAAVLSVQAGAHTPIAQTNSSVWSGVYASAQADRGKAAYARHCSRCHGDDPANSRNPLSGDRFAEHWESRTLADLFHRIRDTMPPTEALTVGEADKLDVLAYLLQLCEVLGVDALAALNAKIDRNGERFPV